MRAATRGALGDRPALRPRDAAEVERALAGFAPFDARVKGEYGYQVYDNVLSALEFERMVSLAGSTVAHLQRPSDGGRPRKVAFVQCVGSRDANRTGNGYCSGVCCMYAVKEAMIAKEHVHGDLDCVVFNMDMRTFGKGYEEFYERIQEEGVIFVRGRGTEVSVEKDGRLMQH